GQSDTRTDLYALGVVLYLLLTGRLPFNGSNGEAVMAAQVGQRPISPRSLNQRLSPALEAVILRALAKDPSERFQTASDMSGALLAALVISETSGITALTALPEPSARRPAPRTLPLN